MMIAVTGNLVTVTRLYIVQSGNCDNAGQSSIHSWHRLPFACCSPHPLLSNRHHGAGEALHGINGLSLVT